MARDVGLLVACESLSAFKKSANIDYRNNFMITLLLSPDELGIGPIYGLAVLSSTVS